MEIKNKKSWADDGFTTYKAKSNFFAEMSMTDYQGDSSFILVLVVFKRGVKFTKWFPNANLKSWCFNSKGVFLSEKR